MRLLEVTGDRLALSIHCGDRSVVLDVNEMALTRLVGVVGSYLRLPKHGLVVPAE